MGGGVMSQLIQLNQRIKAVETIYKVTHATRLIAMSAHTRLASREPFLVHYREEVKKLFSQTLATNHNLRDQFIQTNPQAPGALIIVIGSQRGFCGSFNSGLCKFFEFHLAQFGTQSTYISIGKKATDLLVKTGIRPAETLSNLSSTTLPAVADVLTNIIMRSAQNYQSITVLANAPKTFFSQRPAQTVILPLPQIPTVSSTLADDYVWQEPPEIVLKELFQLYIHVSIQSLLFSSLVAEQAARFQSMDSATRNAQDLLEVMRRDYNKLRQTKITKELLELSGSFERS